MTVEENFERMKKEYDELSAKETAVKVGERRYTSLEKVIDEVRECYSKLDDEQKSRIHVDSKTGLMATTINPEKAISMSSCGFATGVCNTK